MDFLEKHYKKIVFVIMSAFLAVSLLNANNDSATFDEVAHIPAGYSYITEHDTRLNPEHPPLIKYLSALPLAFMDLNFDTTQDFWTGNLPNKWDEGQWAAGRHFLYQAGNDHNKIIFWSRVPIVILSLILGLFLFKWGKEYFGIAGGLLLFSLYAFDPNILGHNHYVTTDIGIAAFITFSFYYFLKFIKNPSLKNTFKAGIFLGLLLVTKFSSIVVVPVYGLVLLVYPLFRKLRDDSGIEIKSFKKRLFVMFEYFSKGFLALAFAMIMVWSVYKISTYKMPPEIFSQTIDFFFSPEDTNLKAIYTNKVLHALNEYDFTRPIGTYLFGPAWMFKRVSGGNGAYFLEQVGNGFAWYFPVVFAIKETLPFLILLIFAGGYGAYHFIRNFKHHEDGHQLMEKTDKWKSRFFSYNLERFKGYARSGVMAYSMLIFVMLYSYLSITGGLNIGFRHLFPILPFLYILITRKVTQAYKYQHAVSKKTFSVFILAMVLWMAVEAALAYPVYVSYFNQTVGGPKNGYRYVTDSNADWGQDLKRLKVYLDRHPEIDKIRVDYFGGGDIFKTIGEERSILWWDSKRPIENGWYAISANFLQGSIYDERKPAENSYDWTLKYKPIDQVGRSILIYHVTDL